MFVYRTAILIFAQIWLCQAEQISLKLVGGSDLYEGNVLVKRGSDWGLVCDDEWDIDNGHVVCKQLGMGKAIKVTTYNKYKSSRVERIYLDDVKCSGYESNLGECKHREWMQSNCNAGEAAGVVCEGAAAPTMPQPAVAAPTMPQPAGHLLKIIAQTGEAIPPSPAPSPAITEPTVENTDDESSEHGILDFSQRTREILERARQAMNFRPATPEPATRSELPQSIAELLANNEELISSYSNIGDTDDEPSALHSRPNLSDLSSGQAVAALQGRSGSYNAGSNQVGIREPSAAEIKKIDDEIQDMVYKNDQAPPARPYRVEVVGGRRSNEGYVRVTLDNGQRGTICSDNWGIYEAMVVCRQAGKQQAEKSTLIDYYGASNEDKVVYEVNCDGHERSLADCTYKLADRHGIKCSKPTNVAGVVCTSAKLPDLMPNLWALQTSVRIEEKPMFSLQCALEEGCLSSSAHTAQASQYSRGSSFGYGSSAGLFGGYNNGPTRKLLRFSSSIFNNGTADFRPKQHRTQWEWHSCHQHYHSMDSFSHYDIVDSHGNRVAEGHKASFCLEDVECNYPHRKKFSCRGYADQGISVGCADVYKSDLDCQWIDITDLKSGAYIFKLNINPNLVVPELSYDNNAAVCEMTYNGFSAKLSGCVLTRG